MVLNNFSKRTIAVFFLIVSFLVPYYHAHDHHSEYHVTGSEHYDGFEKYDISGHKHTGFHLHLKKDFNALGAAGKFQNKPRNITAHFAASPALINKKAFPGITYSLNEHKPESNFTRFFSGVSPPAC
ncbi:MAG: hypothetical protein HZB30_02310 [Nitrospirae bacterium]|nr:hypothetical protein [Nitrospirota bacterium]